MRKAKILWNTQEYAAKMNVRMVNLMKCRYDLREKCTMECKHINTCAWMKDKSRRARVQQEQKEGDKIGEDNDGTETAKAAGE